MKYNAVPPRYLLSLPPHVAAHYVALAHADPQQWFASSDPLDRKVGSGGGTVWLIRQEEEARRLEGDTFDQRRIIIHAGGESRRLPAYARGAAGHEDVSALHLNEIQHTTPP